MPAHLWAVRCPGTIVSRGNATYAMIMSDKLFHLQAWTPQVLEVAQNVMRDIQRITPELEVLFMGAAALKLPGKNDIDLDILCAADDVPSYTKKLIAVLGKPEEELPHQTAWEFTQDGFEIDCILSDPSISHVPLQKRRFELLQSNPQLLEAYKQLKIACDGLPYEQYEKRKIAFLEKLSS